MSAKNNGSLDRLTQAILASYDSDGRTQRVGKEFLPSRGRIVEILEQVRQVLFPGFFGPKRLTSENVKFHVGTLLSRLSEELADQIRHCMCSDRQCAPCKDPDACQAAALEVAGEFLDRLPSLRAMLVLDAQAAYDGDPAAKSIDEVIYCYPGYYAVTVHRIAHELWQLGVPLMARIMSEHAHSLTGTDIHPGATIGRSFFIDHATGVVIGETTIIGDNVKMYQGVTLGAFSFPKDERGRVIRGTKRHPTIEDDVTIYANATILGGETVIGKGSQIGSNTWIRGSVAPGSTVTPDLPKPKVKAK